MARTHTVAWFENQDGAGTQQGIAAIDDSAVTTLFPRDTNTDLVRVAAPYRFLSGVYAGLDNTVQPRCVLANAPSLRTRYGRSTIELPYISAQPEPSSPPVYNDLRRNPIPLDAGELVGFETINNPGVATDQFIVGVFSDGPITPVDPTGCIPIRLVTAASAMTANAWNRRPVTVADANLATGRYDVYGALAITTSGIFVRGVFPDQANLPAIGMAKDARGDVEHPAFAPGAQGIIGSFHTDNLPSFDFLVDAADNEVQVVDLWVKPTGGRKA